MLNKPYVLISHSSEDKKRIDEITKYLNNKKINCWVAYNQINTSELWPEEIVKAIAECEIFVVVLTVNSNNSNQVKRELAIADKYNKEIYFFQVEPLKLSYGIIYFCTANQVNEVFKTDMNTALDKMASELLLNLKVQPSNEPKPTLSETDIKVQVKSLVQKEAIKDEDLKQIKGSTRQWKTNTRYESVSSFLIWVIIIGIGIYYFGYSGCRDFENHMDEGGKNLDRKIYSWARQDYLKAYRTPDISRKDSLKAAMQIGVCDFFLEKYDTMKVNFYSILKKDSSFYRAYLFLAFYMEDKIKNADSAIYFYSKAIQSKDDLPGAYLSRALLKQRRKDPRAIEDFKKAKKLDADAYKERMQFEIDPLSKNRE